MTVVEHIQVLLHQIYEFLRFKYPLQYLFKPNLFFRMIGLCISNKVLYVLFGYKDEWGLVLGQQSLLLHQIEDALRHHCERGLTKLSDILDVFLLNNPVGFQKIQLLLLFEVFAYIF